MPVSRAARPGFLKVKAPIATTIKSSEAAESRGPDRPLEADPVDPESSIELSEPGPIAAIARGCRVGRVRLARSRRVGRVLAQSPRAGMRLRPGRRASISWLGAGSDRLGSAQPPGKTGTRDTAQVRPGNRKLPLRADRSLQKSCKSATCESIARPLHHSGRGR